MRFTESDAESGTPRPATSPVVRTIARIWTQAALLRDRLGDDARSAALMWAVEAMEEALRDEGESLLTVPEAAAIAGVHPSVIRRALASGALFNVGRRYRPRVRRGDLVSWSPPRGRQGPQSDAADASGGQGNLGETPDSFSNKENKF